jgi:hypothetical protein
MKPSLLTLPLLLLTACGGSPKSGLSEAAKACFDYGADACKHMKDFCAGKTPWSDPAGLEASRAISGGISEQSRTCKSIDANNEAYFSGAVNKGCDLADFQRATSRPYWHPQQRGWGYDPSCE